MSDDRRDDTDSNETTGELRDNTIDFGDEFGEVKFADSDDSAPAISVDSTDTAQLPHWSEQPTGRAHVLVCNLATRANRARATPRAPFASRAVRCRRHP